MMTGALGIINIVLATLFGPVNAVFGGDPDWGLVWPYLGDLDLGETE